METISPTYCPISTALKRPAQTFTFSGKERDAESGLNYFGARYYNSDLSIWISVDPMVDKYPNLSPYTYCADNPVRLKDPDGRTIVGTDGNDVSYSIDEKGTVTWSKNASEDTKRIGNAMLQTETGKKQFDFLIETKTKVTLNVCDNDNGDVMGSMLPGKTYINSDGSIELKDATIDIYEGSISTYLSKDNTKFDNVMSDMTRMGELVRIVDHTIDQFIGAEMCHEVEHLKPDNLKLNYGINDTDKSMIEKMPNQKKADYLREIWELKQ